MFIDNKVAIITGGASGIGLCCAIELLKNGLRATTLIDVNPTHGAQAVERITKEFGENKVLFVQADVTDKKSLENAFKKTVDTFHNIDILVNNAGIMNDLLWEKQIAINYNAMVYGCFFAMEEYMPKYKTGNEGVIVNIASVLGLVPVSFFPVYVGTKHAVVGLSRSLGIQDQYDSCKVRVLAICPGMTDTALVEDMKSKMMNERYQHLLATAFTEMKQKQQFPIQPPEAVGVGLIKIIEEGATGSVWVVEENEVYEIDFLERRKMKK